MIVRSRGVGDIAASEGHTAAWRRTYKLSAAGRGTVHLGGRLTDDFDFDSPTSTYQAYHRELVSTLPGPLITIDSETTWGNSTIRTRISSARTLLNTRFGATTDKVLLSGSSMGGLNVLSWAIQNPTLVKAIALATPAVNLDYMHDNNVGGYAAEIDTAYGGLAAYNAAVAAHDPYQNTATLSGIPMKLWYSTDDPFIDPSHVTTFASAVGASTVNMGAVGHTLPSQAFNEVSGFLAEYA